MANTLDLATIQALLSKQKSRGDYDADLAEFLKSGEAGVEIDLSSGRFAGKRSKQVKVGFDNARKKTKSEGGLVHTGGNLVKVIAQNSKDDADGNPVEAEHVFLINTALLGDGATPEETETPQENAA